LCSPYTADQQLIEDSFHTIISRYTEPHRHYHTVAHLQALLALQERHNGLIKDADVMTFATFFHDIIYDVRLSDNEEKSALEAIEFLNKTSFPPPKAVAVAAFIRATKTHENPTGNMDLGLFLDFDLSILSAPPAAYHAYAWQIRQEYAIYPDEVYKPGRIDVLQHFLTQKAIYKTDVFHYQYEVPARENLQQELDSLK
jgi:predicted metal-dependent HD superfamily phosphohydrolase